MAPTSETPSLIDDPQSAGDFIVEFGNKYPGQPLSCCDIDWIEYCRSRTKRSDFLAAAKSYSSYLEENPGACILGFGQKHKGKRIDRCRDLPYLEWCVRNRRLGKRFPIWREAAKLWLEIRPIRHDEVIRDVGQLLTSADDVLAPSQYETDLHGSYEDEEDEREDLDQYDYTDGWLVPDDDAEGDADSTSSQLQAPEHGPSPSDGEAGSSEGEEEALTPSGSVGEGIETENESEDDASESDADGDLDFVGDAEDEPRRGPVRRSGRLAGRRSPIKTAKPRSEHTQLVRDFADRSPAESVVDVPTPGKRKRPRRSATGGAENGKRSNSSSRSAVRRRVVESSDDEQASPGRKRPRIHSDVSDTEIASASNPRPYKRRLRRVSSDSE